MFERISSQTLIATIGWPPKSPNSGGLPNQGCFKVPQNTALWASKKGGVGGGSAGMLHQCLEFLLTPANSGDIFDIGFKGSSQRLIAAQARSQSLLNRLQHPFVIRGHDFDKAR